LVDREYSATAGILADGGQLIDTRIEKLLIELQVDQSVTLRTLQIYKGKCYDLGPSSVIKRDLTKGSLTRFLLAIR